MKKPDPDRQSKLSFCQHGKIYGVGCKECKEIFRRILGCLDGVGVVGGKLGVQVKGD